MRILVFKNYFIFNQLMRNYLYEIGIIQWVFWAFLAWPSIEKLRKMAKMPEKSITFGMPTLLKIR